MDLENDMTSTHSAFVVRLPSFEKHPNADSLSLVRIFDGFVVCINHNQWTEGQLAVYIQPDSLVDVSRPEFEFLARPDGQNPVRITVKRLRGVYSQGLLIPAPAGVNEGDDVAELLNISHYEPPMEGGTSGNEHRGPPTFGSVPKYDVDTFRKYARIFRDGEIVNVTEKLHGGNCRMVFCDEEIYIGGRTVWMKEYPPTVYWQAFRENPNLEKFLIENPNLMLCGEVYGKVQKGFNYDAPAGTVKFRVFDIRKQDYSFMDVDLVIELMSKYDIPMVPQLGNIPYSKEAIEALADGHSLLGNAPCREGVVVKPMIDRMDSSHANIGRVILKLVSNKYLELK